MVEFDECTGKSSRWNSEKLDTTCLRHTAQYLISRMDDKRSNARQGKFGSQWLNVVPCKNLGLKLDDQQLRIPIGLRLVPSSVMRIRDTVVKGNRTFRFGDRSFGDIMAANVSATKCRRNVS